MSRATETQHHGDEFVERNAWLHLLLGLESWGRAFDALLAAHAPERPPAPSDEPVDARDARVIDLVLGLASMRATLRRILAAAQGPARPPPRRAGDDRRGPAWLR